MKRFLLAADTVHTAAAACDYLAGRLAADDVVTVLAVREPGADPRDGDDAANVAAVRLDGLASVETERRAGVPAGAILDAADGVDEVVLGASVGDPASGTGSGGTARAVIAAAEVPVVVVPGPSV